jgi:hypothetical protein
MIYSIKMILFFLIMHNFLVPLVIYVQIHPCQGCPVFALESLSTVMIGIATREWIWEVRDIVKNWKKIGFWLILNLFEFIYWYKLVLYYCLGKLTKSAYHNFISYLCHILISYNNMFIVGLNKELMKKAPASNPTCSILHNINIFFI